MAYIIFDDYQWRYDSYSKPILNGITIRNLSADQASTPNIELVFQLLVMQHPNYSEFVIDDDWAWARKKVGADKHVKMVSTQSFKYKVLKRIRALKK